MQKSPFKFLDSFTKDDREIFFGRDKEIEELHSRVFESKILLVYGTSGTGKSSIINCGLANRFNDADWLPVSIRRGTDINRSLFEALSKQALTKTPFEKAGAAGGTNYNLERLLRSVWLDHFKPVFLIFDQFEELFIFGSREEKNELIKNVAKVFDSDIQCRFIFSMREEYLAGVTEFERVIPSFLSNRLRIEKMTRQNAIQTIEGPCRVNNIEVEAGFADALLEKLNPDTPEVELTWLQIFLDKIMKLAEDKDHRVDKFSMSLLEGLGEVKDVLGSFLEEQISQLDDPDTGLVVLKSFVSAKGTKRQISEAEVIEYSGTFGKEIDGETVKGLIQRFIRLRILRDKDEAGKYELRHDSLASKIFEKITIVEKELLEIKFFIDNAYANYEKRNLLLSDEDLKYIAPYEDKLFLNEKLQNFILCSKQAFQRARRRRQGIAIAAVSVIIAVLSFFTIWAMRERGNALTQQKTAEEQKNAAIMARNKADSAMVVAVVSQRKAEENEKLALEAKNQAEIRRLEALAAQKIALQQKDIAQRMSLEASAQARKAEEEKQVADSQRVIAQAAEEKAKHLSLLSTAQNLALISQTLEKNPEIMGLLAVQAFNFNIDNGGYVDDPVIFRALDEAFTVLDNSKHSVFRGSENEIRCLAENNKGILGADFDGNIMVWDNEGKVEKRPGTPPPSFINFISLSPSGSIILTGYENSQLILKRLDEDNKKESNLKGHSGRVRASCWNSDECYLATGGNDSLIYIWNIESPDSGPIVEFKGGSAVQALSFCGSDTLISSHDDGSVYLWEIRNSSGKKVMLPSEEKILCFAWDRSRKNLIAGSSNGYMYLTDIRKIPLEAKGSAYYPTGIEHLIFNKDFSLLAVSSWDKIISIYNYNKYFEQAQNLEGAISIENLETRARSLIFTNDNRLIAGMSDKSIRIWETSNMRLASKLCKILNRDMTTEEWDRMIGSDMPYEKTCGRNP